MVKYRVDAYGANKSVKQGKQLHEDIDVAIALAFKVAKHYKCYCNIARVEA